MRPRKATACSRRLCSFFFSSFTHTPSRTSSPRGRRRDPLRKCTRRRRVAAAVGAAPDSSTGCRMQQTQPPGKHLQLQLVAAQHVDAHSFLLHSAVHIWHFFLCLLSPPPPLFIYFFFSKMSLPDSLRSSSRPGGRHRKGARENKNVNHRRVASFRIIVQMLK